MAAKSVVAFFGKVAESKPLQAKLKALHKKTVKETEKVKSQASAEVVKLAAAAGFKFTLKDLAKARGGKPRKPSRAELAEVAGQGLCDYSVYQWCLEQHTCIRSWYG